jgi:hypothetical protein
VYEQIKCILYANIDADGQMSAAQLAEIQTQIDTLIGGTPNLVFDLFAGLWGEVQWSNAGATGEYEGECDECGGTCFEQVYVAGSQPFNLTFFSGEWNTGGALNSGCIPYSALNVSIQLGAGGCTYESGEFDYSLTGGSMDWYAYGMLADDPFGGTVELASGTLSSGTGTQAITGFTPDVYHGYQLVIVSEADTTCEKAILVTAVRICSPDLASAGLTSNCDVCPE